jgi:hypothetical protein
MWSWRAKAAQMAGADISNFTFLRSIGMAAIAWPIPLAFAAKEPLPVEITPMTSAFALMRLADDLGDLIVAATLTKPSAPEHYIGNYRRRNSCAYY